MPNVTPSMLIGHMDDDVRFADGEFTGDLFIGGRIVSSGAGFLTPIQPMAANGAVTIKTCIVQITKAGVCAMTLAAPTAAQEGTVITFDSATAQAHTLTVAGGLRGAGSGADVGTWGGAIGDGVTLYAYNLFWWPIPASNLNVTFA